MRTPKFPLENVNHVLTYHSLILSLTAKLPSLYLVLNPVFVYLLKVPCFTIHTRWPSYAAKVKMQRNTIQGRDQCRRRGCLE